MSTEMIAIEVAYASPTDQDILALQVPADATVEQAIQASGILARFPEIDLSQNDVGVFSKATKLDAGLVAGDRIEIYRPLIADPKAARKKRAAKDKT